MTPTLFKGLPENSHFKLPDGMWVYTKLGSYGIIGKQKYPIASETTVYVLSPKEYLDHLAVKAEFS